VTDIRKVLAENMKLYRKTKGLSQNTLAEKIDSATSYIAMIETGKQFPSPQMMEKIAAALEIDTPDLFMAKKFEIYALEERYKAVLGCLEEIIRAELNKLSVH
jgi:transcriptional regulator with XRE-family HTH domain